MSARRVISFNIWFFDSNAATLVIIEHLRPVCVALGIIFHFNGIFLLGGLIKIEQVKAEL